MKKGRILFLFSAVAIVIAAMAIFTYVTLTFDPFGWGRLYSSKFSWGKFAEVQVGENIDNVISLLGVPIRPAESLTVLTTDPRDPCLKGGCKKYLFAGGAWGPTFKEAIVIVNSRGYVVYVEVRNE